ncbi:hypothetical protein HF909_09205 [Ralstonia pseudosolanacearum]|uniref:Uncharacterized protein n=1 Tax=Ralstonia solanacearum TaxID=305 RepID=A0AA92K184_RALSL|nr:hypothetical protein [Ralstonia pseudosolanacearum]QOK96597.1 hypothetical protein HF909_09205 [Ralstonia pseudosolanacearum]
MKHHSTELEKSFVPTTIPRNVVIEAVREASASIGVAETLRALCYNSNLARQNTPVAEEQLSYA